MMISLVCWILAIFFNAVCDAIENENFGESIFKNLPKQFWYKRESWKYAPKIFKYRLDAWHLAKSFMIICILLVVIFFDLPLKKWQDFALYFVVGGGLWVIFFNLFYHKIFRIK